MVALSFSFLAVIVACGTDKKVNLASFCQEKPDDPECKGRSTAPPVASCDPSTQPDAAIGVFVAPGGSDLSGDGSRERPYATVEKALDSGKSNVYLAASTYSVSKTLELSRSITLDGGWTPSFQRACGNPQGTVLQATSATVSPVVRVKSDSSLVNLTVRTVEQAPAGADNQAGASLIGIWASGVARLRLEQVTVVSGKAGDGGPVSAAGAEASGAVACNGVSDCLCEEVNANPFDASLYEACVAQGPRPQEGPSAPRAGSASGTYGTFTAEGYQPGDGAEGTAGQAGQNGINGSPYAVLERVRASYRCVCAATGKLCISPEFCDQYKDSSSCGGAMSPPNASEPTLANGRCGCGGQGGGGGRAGRGGGASVGVVVTEGSVQVQQTKIVVGAGGKGSAGGEGGLGGSPSEGQEGQACVASQSTGQSATSCTWDGAVCATTTTTTTKGGGRKGSAGAQGVAGGQGGPGAGGPSFGVVTLAGAQAVVGEGTEIQPGPAGTGAPGALDGEAAAQKAL